MKNSFLTILISASFLIPPIASAHDYPLPPGSFVITNDTAGHEHYQPQDDYSLDYQAAVVPKEEEVNLQPRCWSYGAPILASSSGRVEKVQSLSARKNKSAGYGAHVRIRHDDGSLGIYAHMINDSNRSYVKVGDHVKTGQIIGLMGDTGYVSDGYKEHPCPHENNYGTHLHYELRDFSIPPELGKIHQVIRPTTTLIDPSKNYSNTHFGKYPFVPEVPQVHSISPLTAAPNSRTTFLLKGKYLKDFTPANIPFCSSESIDYGLQTTDQLFLTCTTTSPGKHTGSFPNLSNSEGVLKYEITLDQQSSPTSISSLSYIPPKPGETLQLTLNGKSLSTDLNIQIQSESDKSPNGNCNTNQTFQKVSATQLVTSCSIPLNIGPVKQRQAQTFQITINDSDSKLLHQESFEVSYEIASAQLTPLQANYFSPTRFTISGKNVHRTQVFFIEGCNKEDIQIIDQQYDQVTFECFIHPLPNTTTEDLSNKSFSHRFFFKTKSRYNDNWEVIVSDEEDEDNTIISGFITLSNDSTFRVNSVTPTTAIIGQETTFTVRGNQLANNPIPQLENCHGEGGPVDIIPESISSTELQFRCTPQFTPTQEQTHQELLNKYQRGTAENQSEIWQQFDTFFQSIQPSHLTITQNSSGEEHSHSEPIFYQSETYDLIQKEDRFQSQFYREDGLYQISGPAEVTDIQLGNITRSKREQTITILGENLPYDTEMLSDDCAQIAISYGSSERFEMVCLLKKTALEELQIIDGKAQQILETFQTDIKEVYSVVAERLQDSPDDIYFSVTGVNLTRDFIYESVACEDLKVHLMPTKSALYLHCQSTKEQHSSTNIPLSIKSADGQILYKKNLAIGLIEQVPIGFIEEKTSEKTLQKNPIEKEPTPTKSQNTPFTNSFFDFDCDTHTIDDTNVGICQLDSPLFSSAQVHASIKPKDQQALVSGILSMNVPALQNLVEGLDILPGTAEGLAFLDALKKTIVLSGDIEAVGFDAKDLVGFPMDFSLYDFSGDMAIGIPDFDISRDRSDSTIILGLGELAPQLNQPFKKYQQAFKRSIQEFTNTANAKLHEQKIKVGAQLVQSIDNTQLQQGVRKGYINVLKALQIVPEHFSWYDNFDLVLQGKLKSEPFRPKTWGENHRWIANANLASIEGDLSAKDGRFNLKGNILKSLTLFNNELINAEKGLANAELSIDLKKDEGRLDIDEIAIRLPNDVAELSADAHFTHLFNLPELTAWGNLNAGFTIAGLEILQAGAHWQFDPNLKYQLGEYVTQGVLSIETQLQLLKFLTATGKAVFTAPNNELALDLGGALDLDFFGNEKRIGDILSRTRIGLNSMSTCMNSKTGKVILDVPFSDIGKITLAGGLSFEAKSSLHLTGPSTDSIAMSGQLTKGGRKGVHYDANTFLLKAFTAYNKPCDDAPGEDFLRSINAQPKTTQITSTQPSPQQSNRSLVSLFIPEAKAEEGLFGPALWDVEGWLKLSIPEGNDLQLVAITPSGERYIGEGFSSEVPNAWTSEREWLMANYQEVIDAGYSISLEGTGGTLILRRLGNEEETVLEYEMSLSQSEQNILKISENALSLNNIIIQEVSAEKRPVSASDRSVKADVSSKETFVFDEPNEENKTLSSSPKSVTTDYSPPTTDLFSDIQSPVLKEAVSYLVRRGIIEGYADNTFRPDQTINRAEALKIIFKAIDPNVSETENCKIGKLQNCNAPFTDTPQNAWYTPYIEAALNKKIIQGYPDGTFKPSQNVNRAEFIKMSMLSQDLYLEPDSFSSTYEQFKDIEENAWYLPTVTFGLINEFLPQSTRLRPTEAMTRGDAAIIIYKIEKYKEELALLYSTKTST